VKRARILTTALLSGVLGLSSPLLAGCYQGPTATTTVQATQPTGSGVDVQVGQIRVQNVLLVAGPIQGATDTGQPFTAESATLIGRVFNDGETDDAIRSITIAGNAASLMVPTTATNPLTIPALDSIPLSYPEGGPFVSGAFADGALPMSSYVDVAIMFERAGLVEMQVLLVPQTGVYADVPLM
jgi:hypothetical protein